jgi:hypothetical protein
MINWSISFMIIGFCLILTGCQTPAERLKTSIDALQFQTIGGSDLGIPFAASTKNTRYIVSKGQKAVPLLVVVLKENEKPMLVGYAAYCLRIIGSSAGKEEAINSIGMLKVKNKVGLNMQEQFALHELVQYVNSIEETR